MVNYKNIQTKDIYVQSRFPMQRYNTAGQCCTILRLDTKKNKLTAGVTRV